MANPKDIVDCTTISSSETITLVIARASKPRKRRSSLRCDEINYPRECSLLEFVAWAQGIMGRVPESARYSATVEMVSGYDGLSIYLNWREPK